MILVDDMGFSDLGCYGSEIPTPNLDKLAADGLRFTQFYNTARCCPTRASLLTGLYPHQAGVGHMIEDQRRSPATSGRLNDRCVTIAEVLQPAGYFTAMTGKWHVGQNHGVSPVDARLRPLAQRGRRRLLFPDSPRAELFLQRRRTSADEAIRAAGEAGIRTDLWTDFGMKFIDEARRRSKPFFLYLAHNAPHFPLQAPPEEIAKFRGKYKAGWDKLRDSAHASRSSWASWTRRGRCRRGPTEVKAWDSAAGRTSRTASTTSWPSTRRCVAHMDHSGRPTRRRPEAARRAGQHADPVHVRQRRQRRKRPGRTARRRSARHRRTRPSSSGQSWATLSNTPFRRYKHFNHEGGIATPLIVALAGADQDARRTAPRSRATWSTSWPPAWMWPARSIRPSSTAKPIQPMEGRSLVPAFDNQPIEREALYWEHEGNAAVRVGDWKLVRLGRNGAVGALRPEGRPHRTARPGRAEPDVAKATRRQVGSLGRAGATSMPYPTERAKKKETKAAKAKARS